MYKNLSHIGIAVSNLSKSLEIFQNLFDAEPSKMEHVEEQKVNLSFFEVGGMHIELLEASAPDSPISKFIEKRGEGIHHLSFYVDDIEFELIRLKNKGVHLIDEKARIGAGGNLIAFIHPRSTNGVLIELTQRQK